MITAGEGAKGFAALFDERARVLDRFAHHARHASWPLEGLLAETRSYALSAPGKLLRPLLMLEACRAAGGDPDTIFPAAAGTEYAHVASLIHDDIIDGDQERRGQLTLHVKYNLGSAIVTGDLLIFETFLSYTQCHDRGVSAEAVLAAIRVLSLTSIEVCRGQALEETIAGDLDVTEQTYMEMIRLKTASACRAATRIGALLSDAPDQIIDALGRYGEYLGTAFQIIDDMLSYEGRPVVVGKSLKSDLRNQRVTLPVIYVLQSGGPEIRCQIRALFTAAEEDDAARHARLTQLLTASRALDRARAQAYRYTNMAKQQLDLVPPSESRECLRSLADIFMARDH
jgi:geranylgeranyl diphosphate synthase type I